jgi:prohibitin 2
MSFKGARIPSAPAGGGALVKAALVGGAGLYAALNSFYNVEGGHRAIVFNRIEGIKEKVSRPASTPRALGLLPRAPPLWWCHV